MVPPNAFQREIPIDLKSPEAQTQEGDHSSLHSHCVDLNIICTYGYRGYTEVKYRHLIVNCL